MHVAGRRQVGCGAPGAPAGVAPGTAAPGALSAAVAFALGRWGGQVGGGLVWLGWLSWVELSWVD